MGLEKVMVAMLDLLSAEVLAQFYIISHELVQKESLSHPHHLLLPMYNLEF